MQQDHLPFYPYNKSTQSAKVRQNSTHRHVHMRQGRVSLEDQKGLTTNYLCTMLCMMISTIIFVCTLQLSIQNWNKVPTYSGSRIRQKAFEKASEMYTYSQIYTCHQQTALLWWTWESTRPASLEDNNSAWVSLTIGRAHIVMQATHPVREHVRAKKIISSTGGSKSYAIPFPHVNELHYITDIPV